MKEDQIALMKKALSAKPTKNKDTKIIPQPLEKNIKNYLFSK